MVEASSDQVIVTHYVIEHYEEEFSDWTFAEYVNMILSLQSLYDSKDRDQNHQEKLVLTNFPFIAKLKRGELEEDELGSRKNTEKFVQIINKACFKDSVVVSERAFRQLTTASNEESTSQSADQSVQLAQLFQSQIAGDLSNICFMDMRSPDVLKPSER